MRESFAEYKTSSIFPFSNVDFDLMKEPIIKARLKI